MNIRHAKYLLKKATVARCAGETLDAARLAAGALRCALQCRSRDKYTVARKAFHMLSELRTEAVSCKEKSDVGSLWAQAKTIFLK